MNVYINLRRAHLIILSDLIHPIVQRDQALANYLKLGITTVYCALVNKIRTNAFFVF